MPKTLKSLFQILTLAILVVGQFTSAPAGLAREEAGDGITTRYAVLIHGYGDETYWWPHLMDIYDILLDEHDFDDDSIFLFYRSGENDPQIGEHPERLDGAATEVNLYETFRWLSENADADDEVIVWIPNHGDGYYGKDIQDPQFYARLTGFASVDAGDEPDYLESEFKLLALHTDGDYPSQHGMGTWHLFFEPNGDGTYKVFRHKYVGSFPKTYFEEYSGHFRSDNDPYIEEFIDYLTIDSVDGLASGDITPEDLDATSFNPETGEFNEADWGKINKYDENIRLGTFAPGLLVDFVVHDLDQDNHLDIDLNYRPGDPLESDGEDTDNDGLFDGLNVNEDSDMNDWISIDDDVALVTSRLTDDLLDGYLDMLNVRAITVVISSCFSGGFIWELSGPNRVIIANTSEEVFGYDILFSREFLGALKAINADAADMDGIPGVSMLEAFNYATSRDQYWCGNYNNPIDPNDPPDCEEPLYDDNNDGEGSAYDQINSGISQDGIFGSSVYLK
jgi:hypothetical protein